MTPALLDIQGLCTEFRLRHGVVRAVDGVDLQLHHGETLGIVGESGCGKSVTALSILRLIPKPQGRIAAGRILYAGVDLVSLPESALRRLRGNEISMIFQEPMTSLNPVSTVGFQIQEVLRKHRGLSKKEAAREAVRALSLVGIPDPESRAHYYPHQMSGGMRQRVMIAMALACRPRILIADEPTTALDVTIQAQILDLMRRLKEEIGMAVLLITHDLGVVAETCRRVVVMYAGRVVEEASVEELFSNPAHPYTQGLFASLPKIAGPRGKLTPIPGTVPSLHRLPQGCAFQDRCSRAKGPCLVDVPPWTELSQGHRVRCWHLVIGS
ncbi:ABC transporter ATP-binding protein [Desulfosoma caldarium]|uniref:Peptide/nickel transport system ATP-binding protein/oligopeptide transport system ATP-binding protein n=1 Tax=Desulfosoma caldarium TaxID=610254 RepID=A0A3N1UY29_9BACT|nr:ABC transporter ATP-binding protein [Desulfosoma caldarium]ROQ93447.1 peptide/nickel transport system ATP-binding protein/oligopeptide transport system ATP-binding protein [Desulfosoma caldarium]